MAHQHKIINGLYGFDHIAVRLESLKTGIPAYNKLFNNKKTNFAW